MKEAAVTLPLDRAYGKPLKASPFAPLATGLSLLLGTYIGNWFLSAHGGPYTPYWLQVSAPVMILSAYSAWREFRLKHGA